MGEGPSQGVAGPPRRRCVARLELSVWRVTRRNEQGTRHNARREKKEGRLHVFGPPHQPSPRLSVPVSGKWEARWAAEDFG